MCTSQIQHYGYWITLLLLLLYLKATVFQKIIKPTQIILGENISQRGESNIFIYIIQSTFSERESPPRISWYYNSEMLRDVRQCTPSNTHLPQDLPDQQQANCRCLADTELIMSHPLHNIAELFCFTVQNRDKIRQKKKDLCYLIPRILIHGWIWNGCYHMTQATRFRQRLSHDRSNTFFLWHAHCAHSYNRYVIKQLHSVIHRLWRQLLHVSAPRCHFQGVIIETVYKPTLCNFVIITTSVLNT